MSNLQQWTDGFLVDLDPKRWSAPDGFPASMTPAGMFAQDAPNGLEVVLASVASRPSVSDLRRAWEKRRAKRASPVLLVVGYPSNGGTQVAVCGPALPRIPLTPSMAGMDAVIVKPWGVGKPAPSKIKS